MFPGMRVTVNSAECEANGVCVGIEPTVFELDDDDVLHILITDVPSELEAKVRDAVGRCPKRALYLHED